MITKLTSRDRRLRLDLDILPVPLGLFRMKQCCRFLMIRPLPDIVVVIHGQGPVVYVCMCGIGIDVNESLRSRRPTDHELRGQHRPLRSPAGPGRSVSHHRIIQSFVVLLFYYAAWPFIDYY